MRGWIGGGGEIGGGVKIGIHALTAESGVLLLLLERGLGHENRTAH